MTTNSTPPPANHIALDPDFVTDGLAEMPDFMQKHNNYAKLVDWYSNRWEKLDQEVVKLAYMRLLDNAEGKVLDTLGEKVGLPRANQTDIEYRALIKLRAFRQTQTDTRPDIVELLKIIFFGEAPLITKFNSGFVEIIVPANCLSDIALGQQLEDMFPVNAYLWATQTDGVSFYFTDTKDDIQEPDTGGLSDSKEISVESLLTNWIHSSARGVKNV